MIASTTAVTMGTRFLMLPCTPAGHTCNSIVCINNLSVLSSLSMKPSNHICKAMIFFSIKKQQRCNGNFSLVTFLQLIMDYGVKQFFCAGQDNYRVSALDLILLLLLFYSWKTRRAIFTSCPAAPHYDSYDVPGSSLIHGESTEDYRGRKGFVAL